MGVGQNGVLVDGQAGPCMALVHGSVHGSVHGAGWVGGGVVYLFEPVTSLLVGCYLKMDIIPNEQPAFGS